jgi:hypothetical protein
MTIEAELADGSVLEFPDGTSPQVVQAAVKKMIASQGAPAPVQTPVPAPVAPTVSPSAPSQKPAYQPTVFEEATGAVVEPLMKMGSSLIAKPVSEVMGISAMFADYLGDKGGNPMGFKNQIQQDLTYEPRTVAGRSEYNPLNAIPNAIGNAISAVGTPVKKFLTGDASDESVRGMVVNAAGEAVPQALGMVGVKNAPLISQATRTVGKEIVSDVAKDAAFKVRAAKEAASTADWQRAAQIEAAKTARDNDIILNPSSVSESPRTIRMAAAGGSAHFNTAASIANKSKWNDMVRADLGLDKNAQLTSSTYDTVRKIIAKPYDDAAKLGTLAPNADVLTAIREIDIPEILPAGEVAAGKMARTTDYVTNQIENGMTGKMALDTTKTLRREAKQVFDSVRSGNRVPPVEIDAAKGKMRLAEKIDELISSNIPDPKWKSSFDDSRRKMALTYAYERATNLAKRQIDPQVFAQEMEGRHWLTGNAKKMGEIAANYPEIANVYAEHGKTFGMPVRSGVVGTTGFAVGSLYGAPVATSAFAAAAGSLGEKIYGKYLRSGAGQAKYATPVDRRIMPTPETPAQRGVVPYVSPTEVVGEMPYRPNFTAGKPDSNPTFTGPNYQQPQIGMFEGPVGGQIGALRAEDARVRAESMRQGKAAESAQAAAESATPRQPTRGGMLFDLDPITGKLRAADQRVKGASPEIFQADTGSSLKSAAEKVASGRTFDMTAAEKVAWNKTAVDIQEALPEFKGLTDKQVQAKMADRQWVQSVIDKANQQTQTLGRMEALLAEQLANRTNYRLMAHEIATKTDQVARLQAERARMMSIVEQLQDTLSARPRSSGMQGPKTRAFQRGMLTGENQ